MLKQEKSFRSCNPAFSKSERAAGINEIEKSEARREIDGGIGEMKIHSGNVIVVIEEY